MYEHHADHIKELSRAIEGVRYRAIDAMSSLEGIYKTHAKKIENFDKQLDNTTQILKVNSYLKALNACTPKSLSESSTDLENVASLNNVFTKAKKQSSHFIDNDK